MQMVKQHGFKDYHWADIRDRLIAHNAILANLLDDCQSLQPTKLTIASLPYGAYFVKNGKCISDTRASAAHATTTSHTTPLADCIAVVLDGCFENFHQFQERIAPISCFMPGDIMGLATHRLFTRQYVAPLSFQITAGARSLFMLPKITDSASHKNIQREFNIRIPTPKKLLEHWDVFRLLAQQPQKNQPTPPWQAQCLMLPAAWLDPHNSRFHALQHYLLQLAQQQQEYWRHQYLWNLTFSRIQSIRNLKPNPFLADTCKHLFAIGVGAVPGFSAALTDQLAPIRQLQKIYVDVYDLKHYAPVLMQPQCYQFQVTTAQNPVYYSLQLPTLLEFSPKSRNLSSTISDLREVRHIISTYLSELSKTDLGIENSPIHEFSKNAEFSFFHSELDAYGEIHSTQTILDQDAHFQLAHNACAESSFSENSPFVRGCVRISAATPTTPKQNVLLDPAA